MRYGQNVKTFNVNFALSSNNPPPPLRKVCQSNSVFALNKDQKVVKIDHKGQGIVFL